MSSFGRVFKVGGDSAYPLRCRILLRMRRFLRPSFRRPFPVFLVPIRRLFPCAVSGWKKSGWTGQPNKLSRRLQQRGFLHQDNEDNEGLNKTRNIPSLACLRFLCPLCFEKNGGAGRCAHREDTRCFRNNGCLRTEVVVSRPSPASPESSKLENAAWHARKGRLRRPFQMDSGSCRRRDPSFFNKGDEGNEDLRSMAGPLRLSRAWWTQERKTGKGQSWTAVS